MRAFFTVTIIASAGATTHIVKDLAEVRRVAIGAAIQILRDDTEFMRQFTDDQEQIDELLGEAIVDAINRICEDIDRACDEKTWESGVYLGTDIMVYRVISDWDTE